MSRQINVNTPVSRRRSGLRGRRLSYSPEATVPTPAPSYSPEANVPTPAPRYSILARRAAERATEAVRAWHVIGDINEPVTSQFVHNNAEYTVHGNAPFSMVDFQEEPDLEEENVTAEEVVNEAANRAHRRAVQLHEHLHEPQETTEPLPNYSPVHSPDLIAMEDLETPQNAFESFDGESEDEVAPLPQVDMAVFCHICSCTFTDIKNYNSSFVTTSECDHAVCFKCYSSIVFDKESFKCSMCNRATPTCRVYNHQGFVEISSTRSVRDRQAIKTHWAKLLNNNMSDSNVSEQSDIQKLQAEMAELRASTARAQHQAAIAHENNSTVLRLLNAKTAQLEDELNAKYGLINENEQLKEHNRKLQSQIDAQNFKTKALVEEYLRQQTNLLDNLRNVIDK
ncbi:immediate early protein 2 [Choristoneura diversana nucleopolyhedrovirus]|nr:immediate early protein 2 [Choristoneura diversana nucleopolyhedrovirus]